MLDWVEMDSYFEEIEDPVFGTLVKFVGKSSWTRRWDSPKLGDFEIDVEAGLPGEGTGPTAEQQQAGALLVDHIDRVEELCGQALWENYRKDFEEMDSEEREEFGVPDLDDPEDIWKLVSCKEITFPTVFCDFHVRFEVPWDTEHGCVVSFKDLQVIEVE